MVYTLDQNFGITQIQEPNGNTVTWSFEGIEHSDGYLIDFQRNGAGQITAMILPDGRQVTYTYSPEGDLLSVTDLMGNTTEHRYMQSTNPHYDEQNSKLTQTDALGRTTTWAYDSMGRIISRTLPLGQVETHSYDLQGRKTSHTDFNGATHNYSYTPDNDDVLRIDYEDGTFVEYTYTANRLMETATTESGVTQYTYDERDRVLSETQPNSAVLTYTYDFAGNRTQVSVTKGTNNTLTDYSFDELNRLSTVTDASGTTTYTYDPVGNRGTVTYPNDTLTQYTYDTRNRLVQLQTQDPTNQVLQQFDKALVSWCVL